MTSTDVDDAPAAQRATLTDLHGAERGAAAAAHADSLRVTGALAPLLASLYAASDARVELLGAYLAQAGDPAGAAR
ncbi:hypothetical protein [Frankia canadensis]|nr:hypothetical protein [Frankia canadensis]